MFFANLDSTKSDGSKRYLAGKRFGGFTVASDAKKRIALRRLRRNHTTMKTQSLEPSVAIPSAWGTDIATDGRTWKVGTFTELA